MFINQYNPTFKFSLENNQLFPNIHSISEIKFTENTLNLYKYGVIRKYVLGKPSFHLKDKYIITVVCDDNKNIIVIIK